MRFGLSLGINIHTVLVDGMVHTTRNGLALKKYPVFFIFILKKKKKKALEVIYSSP